MTPPLKKSPHTSIYTVYFHKNLDFSNSAFNFNIQIEVASKKSKAYKISKIDISDHQKCMIDLLYTCRDSKRVANKMLFFNIISSMFLAKTRFTPVQAHVRLCGPCQQNLIFDYLIVIVGQKLPQLKFFRQRCCCEIQNLISLKNNTGSLETREELTSLRGKSSWRLDVITGTLEKFTLIFSHVSHGATLFSIDNNCPKKMEAVSTFS